MDCIDLRREGSDILKRLDIVTKTSSEIESKQRLLENCRNANLMVRDNITLDGNCFFHAVSDQLYVLGLPPLSHDQLRKSVVQYLRNHRHVQGPDGIIDFSAIYPDWEGFCDTMAKDGEWADAVVLVATAHMLQTDILVVTSSPQGENDQIFHRVIADDASRGPPLMLGHVWESHYVSLQPAVAPKVHFNRSGATYIYGNQTYIEGSPTIVRGNQVNVSGDQIHEVKAISDVPDNRNDGSNSKPIENETRPSCGEIDNSNTVKESLDLQEVIKLDTAPSIVGSFDLRQCQEQLRWYYLNCLCKVPLYPGDNETCVDLAEIYTKLSIVLDLPQPCQPIKIPLETHNEIFTRRSGTGDVITRILISGDAGIGKSTLTTKFAYDWATNDPDTPLKSIPLLFVVNMRWVDQSSNIEDMILTQLLPEDTDITRKDLADIIRQLGTKAIIVLDAMDEAHRDFFNNPKKSGNIAKALMGRNLLNTRVIVTTRPWRVGEIVSYNNSFTRFDLHGFAKVDITNYIRQFFRRDKAMGNQLVKYMEENELVNAMATIPLMALLFCLYWKETGGRQIPKRLGQLYDSILHIMQNHLQAKQAEKVIQQKQLRGIYKNAINFTARFKPRPEIAEVVLKLGKPALNGVWPPDNQLIFSSDELEEDIEPVVLDEACKMGLLAKQDSPSILKSHTNTKSVPLFRNTTSLISFAILSIVSIFILSGGMVASAFGIICFTSAYFLHRRNYIHFNTGVGPRKQKKIAFFHKSAQEKCAGEYLASLAHHQPHKMQSYLDSIENLQDALSINMILRFACSASSKATKDILEKLLSLYRAHIQPWMSHFHEEKLGLDDTRTIQQYLDMCLGCNYEADAKELFCPLLSELFPKGQLNSLGMSSLSAVSIAYFMTHSRSDPIRSITLRPVAHINDPLAAQGPLSEILQKALHGIQFYLSEGQVRKICDAYFDKKQGAVHQECKVLVAKSPTLMLAHLQVIQACEGLPFTGEANLTPVINSFRFTQIDKLDFSELKLGSNIDHLISIIERGDLANLLELNVTAIGMTGYQTQRLAGSLSKTRQLNLLKISRNEPGRSFYILAQVLPDCPSLWVLDIGDMTATSDNMSAILKAIPNFASQLEQLLVHGNIMNDAVGMAFINNICKAHALLCLEISVSGVSRELHDNILQCLGQLPRLVKLGIWGSPFPEALLKSISFVLDKFPALRYLRLNAHYNVSPNVGHTTWVLFRGKLLTATRLNFLALVNICLEDNDFQNLMAVCRRHGYAYLGYSMECLPEGIDAPKDTFFNVL